MYVRAGVGFLDPNLDRWLFLDLFIPQRLGDLQMPFSVANEIRKLKYFKHLSGDDLDQVMER